MKAGSFSSYNHFIFRLKIQEEGSVVFIYQQIVLALKKTSFFTLVLNGWISYAADYLREQTLQRS